MFDQALGTSTSATGSIEVALDAGDIRATALLDVVGTTVRVRKAGYDRTLPVAGGTLTFLDLPAGSGQVTVTITGGGTVSVGTLLVGRVLGLGITEASPSAGITDYSRKEVDEFGAVAIVQRAWAKRMQSASDSEWQRAAIRRGQAANLSDVWSFKVGAAAAEQSEQGVTRVER